jgi:hypothetical protein
MVLASLIVLHLTGCCTKTISPNSRPDFCPKEQVVVGVKGNWQYSSYHGHKTKTCAVWRGNGASVSCIFLGDGSYKGWVLARSYSLAGMPVRNETIFSRSPLILLLEEYDPRTGKKMIFQPVFIHQEEAAEYFQAFIKKNDLERVPQKRGQSTRVL